MFRLYVSLQNTPLIVSWRAHGRHCRELPHLVWRSLRTTSCGLPGQVIARLDPQAVCGSWRSRRRLCSLRQCFFSRCGCGFPSSVSCHASEEGKLLGLLILVRLARRRDGCEFWLRISGHACEHAGSALLRLRRHRGSEYFRCKRSSSCPLRGRPPAKFQVLHVLRD